MRPRKALLCTLIICSIGTRAQQSGNPDLSFSGDGIATADFTTNHDDRGLCMLVQPDGRILMAGGSHQGNGTKFAIARFMPDGALDNSFGTGGRATIQVGAPPSLDESIYALALQADGKIVCAGRTFVNAGVGYQAAVLRFNSNGTLDNSFSGNGVQVDNLGAGDDDSYYGVAVQPDGGIVVAGVADGSTNYDAVVARYTTSGVLDATFSSDGYSILDIGTIDDRANAMVLQPDGNIVIAGQHGPPATDSDFLLARFTPSGALDTGFGTNGIVISAFSTSTDWAYGLALQPDGRLVATGITTVGGVETNLALARYEADGDLDPTFAGDGLAVNSYSNVCYARSVAILPDGRIAAGGNTLFDLFVAMYNADGTPDLGFSVDGVATPDPSGNAFGYAVAVQSDSKLLMAGQVNFGTAQNNFTVARYHTQNGIGVEEIGAYENPLVVLPNPARDLVRVSGRANDILRITDMTGRAVLVRTMRTDELTMDVSRWARGSYLIMVEREGRILRERMVVE